MKHFWPNNATQETPLSNQPPSLSFCVTQLEFNDGTQLRTSPDDLVVLVGPNNVGKTATLAEIVRCLKKQPTKILRGLSAAKEGTISEVRAWLDRHYIIDQRYEWYGGWGGAVSPDTVARSWDAQDSLGNLTEFFCRFVGTDKRLEASRPADNIDVLTEPCEKPIQVVAANPDFEQQLSTRNMQAFGIPLFLDRWSGKRISIRCGEVPTTDPWTMSFLRDVRSLPSLESQGDGMRSFVGCILEAFFSPHFLVLVDEPEAFLHPQNARVLGQMLASEKPKNRQLFLATHSVHLLLGLLDSPSGKIRVVRIQRDGDYNPVCELEHNQIKDIWQDPLLRASNTLEGIFHEAVVLCEGDADCRFYSCVLDAIVDMELVRHPDVMFASCGGKSKMPLVIRALIALGVPVRTVVDFDILQNSADLKAIVEAYNASWTEFEPMWKTVNNSLQSIAAPLSLAQVRSKISELLDAANGAYLDDKTLRALQNCLRTASPWGAAKRSGKASLPSGGPMAAYSDLTVRLRVMGVFIVECGELERFAPSVGTHGPAWVTEVFRKALATDEELEEARRFVRNIVGMEPSRSEGRGLRREPNSG